VRLLDAKLSLFQKSFGGQSRGKFRSAPKNNLMAIAFFI